jgi:multicomponent Na+:H+ antiporter subunit E
MTKANVDVAYRVLHPRMPIRPGIVKIRTRIKSEAGRVFLANSITLTPGTLSVDLSGDVLYIHWIYVRETDMGKATEAIIGRFESLIMKIFD